MEVIIDSSRYKGYTNERKLIEKEYGEILNRYAYEDRKIYLHSLKQLGELIRDLEEKNVDEVVISRIEGNTNALYLEIYDAYRE